MTEGETVGWHHRLSEREFERAAGDGAGQGGLVRCSHGLTSRWTQLSEWTTARTPFVCACLSAAQSCLILCSPVVCNPPGSSVHRSFQARILEQVVMPYSRGASQARVELTSLASPVLAGGFFTTEPPSKQRFSLASIYLFSCGSSSSVAEQ